MHLEKLSDRVMQELNTALSADLSTAKREEILDIRPAGNARHFEAYSTRDSDHQPDGFAVIRTAGCKAW